MNERNLSAEVVREVKKAIVGKDSVLVKVLAAILARGHILLEDIPGVGKTTLALAFAKALDLRFSRMQFTPDVMPSDITGFTLYNKATGQMEYQPGAVMCNLFLADELNRATSRTQSALLEAMEEGQVTVDGVSHPVPQPFVVIATQNPVGASGTQRLPDSQLDRFLLRLSLGYPSPAEELELLRRRQYGQSMGGVSQVVDSQSLEQLRQALGEVVVDRGVLEHLEEGEKAPSPGMKYKHYAPRAEVVLVKGSTEGYRRYLENCRQPGEHAMCFTQDLPLREPVLCYGGREDHAAQAERLFDLLRQLDRTGAKKVYIHAPAPDGVGLAVYNRLIRAAAFRVVEV